MQEKRLETEAQYRGLTTWGEKMEESQRADLIHLRDAKKETEEEREKAKERRRISNDGAPKR